MKPIYCSLLLLCLCLLGQSSVQGQSLCDGNLGENIFEAGDFGSGEPNILLPNPNIAPGYQYTTSVPPNDGFYTVTNSTMNWSRLWNSWLRLEDNSDDPEGYMMVVNASFTPGVFFEQTIDNLCENTDYEFSADIINLIRSSISGHIAPNVSFLLDNELKFSTGNIPQSNDWITYGFTFRTEPGQTQLTLTLQNNAPGGIGNDLALDNISFRACGPSAFINTEQNIFLCENDNNPAPITAELSLDDFAIQWQVSLDGGQNWNDIPGENGNVYFHDNFAPGVYLYRYLSASSEVNLANFKCRIISDVITIEVLPLRYESVDTICENTPYFFGTDTLFGPGMYSESFISSRGCDSIVTLDLAVVPNEVSLESMGTDPSCFGYTDGSVSFSALANASPPIQYFFQDTLVSSTVVENLGEGSYRLVVSDRYQCTAESVESLIVPNPFFINAGPDLELLLGETSRDVRLTYNQTPVDIQWSPSEFLECFNCERTRITGAQDISYVVTATNEEGCPAIDTLNVFVNRTEAPRIFIPNVFSPNGDGVNEYFQLYSYDQLVSSVESLTVFNRWGGVVYESQSFLPNIDELGWDGRSNGERVQNGVYVYIFNIRLIDGSLLQEAGSVTVLY
ncbi:MAG: gliding motility-associated C-terminal domain-containing protein [Bacteroidota bacterium]